MSTRGDFNYLAPSVTPSLYRNGEVLTRRDASGSDSEYKGADIERRQVTVHDARTSAVVPTVERNGFEVLDRPVARARLDFFDHEAVVRTYYEECSAIVADAMKAPYVVAFDHNVRSATGKKDRKQIKGGQEVQGPAHMVHGDYTLRSAPERLQRLTEPLGINDTLRPVLGDRPVLDAERVERALSDGGRFAIVNLWRNIADEPVVTHPLALCDAHSVQVDELVVFEIHYEDRIGENYFSRASDEHRWLYYPALTRDEALLIKQWDSAGGLARSKGGSADADAPDAPCTFSFHSAFEDPFTPPDAPDRWSVEVRCVALFE